MTNVEELVVRPYAGGQELAELLSEVNLTAGPVSLRPGHTAVVDPAEFLTASFVVELASSVEELSQLHDRLGKSLSELGFTAEDVSLVAVATSPRLKLAHTHVISDADCLPLVADLSAGDERPEPFCTPHGGCVIDLYLCLARALPQRPLYAWRKGTWLARVTYRVLTGSSTPRITTIPLRADDRERLGLPSDALRYVDFDDPLDRDSATEVVVYVEESLLAALAHDPRSVAASVLQRQLFIDAATSVVVAAAASGRLSTITYGEIDGTLLGGIVAVVAGGLDDYELPARRERLVDELRTDPRRFLARVEACAGNLREELIALLSGANQ